MGQPHFSLGLPQAHSRYVLCDCSESIADRMAVASLLQQTPHSVLA